MREASGTREPHPKLKQPDHRPGRIPPATRSVDTERRHRMAWSTQQLARLANTTTNTVRHYHKVGLLELPDRGSNGYKQYGAAHLIRLLQIKRLSDLGFSLAQVAEMDRPDQDPADEIRALDAELAESMERMGRVRAELASILEHGASADIPPGFAPVSGQISEAQRSLLTVYSTVFSEPALKQFSEAVAVQGDIDVEFEAPPPMRTMPPSLPSPRVSPKRCTASAAPPRTSPTLSPARRTVRSLPRPP
jgi:DNA-binding transcriptional MerR regulator